MSSIHRYIPKSVLLPSLYEAVFGSILLCGINFLLQWRYGFGWADEGFLWYASQRTSLGELPIRDFFSYDPGRYYWSSLFFHLTGDVGLYSLLLSAAVFGAIGLAAIWFSMCRAGINWKWRVACSILIAIALGFPRHKVYEQSLSLILCAAVFLVLLNPGAAKRWFIFGGLAGLAAFVGRNHGVFFLFAALLCSGYLLIVKQRNLLASASLCFSAGVVIGYLPMIFLFIIKPGFWDAFVVSVLFVSNWQLPLPIPFVWRLNFGGAMSIDLAQAVAVGVACILIPFIYIFGLVIFVAKNKISSEVSPILSLLGASCISGIPYLHQAFGRADFSHIAQAALPVFPAIFALGYYLWFVIDRKYTSGLFVVLSSIVLLISWLPSEPGVRFARMRIKNPDSVASTSIAGKEFVVEKYQADLLAIIQEAANTCKVGRNDFLAAPHFPGIYAFLNSKAPFWENYYLYQRPIEFQQEHIDAISTIRLILLAPDATVDGLERLKLKNTYGLLLEHIFSRFEELKTDGLSGGVKFYVPIGSCSNWGRPTSLDSE